jgi:photosystem II stability/assembly factor-like uncharacterized protein
MTRRWPIALLAIAAAILGCDLFIPSWWPGSLLPIPTATGKLAPTWPAPPTRTPPPTSSAPMATRTPQPTLQARPTRTPHPTQPPAAPLLVPLIDDADLVLDTQGWVRAQGRLFWTDDGGSSWRDITPPIGENAYLWWVRFFDTHRGIALAVAKLPADQWPLEARIVVLRTDDGGRSWAGSAEWATLAFSSEGKLDYAFALSPDQIWVSVDMTQSMNSSMGEVFRTDDGGRSWSKSDLPYSGQVVFVSSDTGFTASSCCYGAFPQLYRTRNGGGEWEQQTLAPIPDDTRWYWHDYGMPVFFGPLEGVTAVALRNADWRPTDLVLYRTRDAGASWEEVTAFAGASESAGISSHSTVLDAASATVWGVILGDVAAVTRDGGESFAEWSLASMSPGVDKLMLSDGELAWALEFHNEGHKLLRTHDQGAHWEAVVGPW